LFTTDGRVSSITEASAAAPLSTTTIKRDAAGRIIPHVPERAAIQDPVPGIRQLGYDAAEQVAGTHDGLRLNSDALGNYA
jgi:hypothetical protein